YGFDNIGDVLSISPLLMEKYVAAAEKVVRTAILTPEADKARMQGPLPLSHQRIFICKPTTTNRDDCARKILTAFARRAFRRPVKKAEVDRLVGYVEMVQKEGESFERGIQLAVEACLVSPHFLFRVEVDPHPHDPRKRPVGPYDLASRL